MSPLIYRLLPALFALSAFLGMTLLDIRTPQHALEFGEYMKSATPAPLQSHAEHRKKDGTLIQVALVGEDFLLEGRPSRLIIARTPMRPAPIGRRSIAMNQLMLPAWRLVRWTSPDS